jgi:hypothetical protein
MPAMAWLQGLSYNVRSRHSGGKQQTCLLSNVTAYFRPQRMAALVRSARVSHPNAGTCVRV